MNSQLSLIKAIRSGQLAEVRRLLDAGTPVEMDDGHGESGLAMGIACFMGHVEIVRELAKRGAKVNLDDNDVATSPLSMAIRGSRTEVVRALIELGAKVPVGTVTGLTDHEIMVAQWQAFRDGHAQESDDAAFQPEPVFEEIEAVRCIGTDTMLLDADLLRAATKLR